jgi:hypothetical protein
MKLDRVSPTDFQLSLQAEELAGLMAAARCTIEPGCSSLTKWSEALVTQLVSQYDQQATTLRSPFQGMRLASVRLDPPKDEYAGTRYDPF